MKVSTKLTRRIQTTKTKLINKAKRKGLWENFGQNELRDIEDEFGYNSLVYGDDEERTMAREIDIFQHWCRNFDLSHLKEKV